MDNNADLSRKILNSIEQTIRKITKESSGLSDIAKNHFLNGSFKQFTESKILVEILFPGASPEMLKGLPKNLKEILLWKELEINLEKISHNAISVLENIKNKGLKSGDVIDYATELVLIPQIGQEALAKGIIDAVRNLNRKASNIIAQTSLTIASPTAEQAQYDQLNEETVSNLSDSKINFAIQHEYMGEDWTELIKKDAIRYSTNEKMSLINEQGTVVIENENDSSSDLNGAKLSWIEANEELNEKYPALFESIKMLQALAFELNCIFIF
jgi:hypothetical protein